MFCPECKSEYRAGFTQCSDCSVDLVESLDSPDAPSDDPDLTAPVLLWSGIHSGTLEEVRAALDEEHILYNDEPLEARLLYASMRPPLEVWVQKSDFDAARRVIAQRLAGDGDADAEVEGLKSIPEEHPDTGVWESRPARGGDKANEADDSDENPEASPEDEILEQPYDPSEEVEEPAPARDMHGDVIEQPSIEVWSGKESDLADYIAMCFREDGIRFVQLPDGVGGFRFLVYPDREERARLIVREVVEGQTPE